MGYASPEAYFGGRKPRPPRPLRPQVALRPIAARVPVLPTTASSHPVDPALQEVINVV